MPITTRSSARHDADVADMYSLLLSSLKDAISEGVHQDGQFVEASSDDESDEESPVELPSLRAGGSAPGAVLATPVSNEDGGKGEGQRSNISSESTESPKNEDAWPLAAWEHQVSMPKPAVSGVPREASPHWATQKAQPAANVRLHTKHWIGIFANLFRPSLRLVCISAAPVLTPAGSRTHPRCQKSDKVVKKGQGRHRRSRMVRNESSTDNRRGEA